MIDMTDRGPAFCLGGSETDDPNPARESFQELHIERQEKRRGEERWLKTVDKATVMKLETKRGNVPREESRKKKLRTKYRRLVE